MNPLFPELALLSILALVLGFGVYAAVVLGRRMLHDEGPLRLNEVLRRHGLGFPDLGTHGAAYEAALAVRRCVACSRKADCDRWLAAGGGDGFEAFCPNAGYIARLQQGQPGLR